MLILKYTTKYLLLGGLALIMIIGIGILGYGQIQKNDRELQVDAHPAPEAKEYRYTPDDLISSAIWAKHLKTFQKHLKTRPEAARAELQNVAKKLFHGHALIEEWVPLYYRLSREGTEHLTDIQRVSDLEIRMLTALNAEKYGLQIQQHQHAMEELKAISAYGRFFEKLSPKAMEALKNATEKHAETLKQRHAELDKKVLENRRESAIERVKHLRTLSIEEQREYLLKREAWQASRPARKRLEVKIPGSTNKLWNQQLQALIDAGYTLPEGVDFR